MDLCTADDGDEHALFSPGTTVRPTYWVPARFLEQAWGFGGRRPRRRGQRGRDLLVDPVTNDVALLDGAGEIGNSVHDETACLVERGTTVDVWDLCDDNGDATGGPEYCRVYYFGYWWGSDVNAECIWGCGRAPAVASLSLIVFIDSK